MDTNQSPNQLIYGTSKYVRVLLIRHGQSESNTAPHLIAGRSSSVGLTERGKYEAYLLGLELNLTEHQSINQSINQSVNQTSDRSAHAPNDWLIDEIHCSTARRAAETAQIIVGAKNDKSINQSTNHSDIIKSIDSYINPAISQSINHQITRHVDLEEQSQGPYEGQDRSIVYTEEINQSMKRLNVDFSLPGGESINQVADRASAVIQSRIDHHIRSFSQSTDISANSSTNQSISQSTNQSVVGLTSCLAFVCHGMVIRALLLRWAGDNSTDESNRKSINQSTDRSEDGSTQSVNRENCWRIPIDNTSVTEFRFYTSTNKQSINQSFSPIIKLVKMNDCKHLVGFKYPT